MSAPFEWLALACALWFVAGVIAGVLVGRRIGYDKGWNAGLRFADRHWMEEFPRIEARLAERAEKTAMLRLQQHGLWPPLEVVQGGKGDEG